MGANTVCYGLIVLAIGVRRIEPSDDTMNTISSGFIKVLTECKHELNLSETIMADLLHFWRLEYDLLNRDTGCIINCMSKKLDLIDVSGMLHHGNAHEFALKHGADQDQASKLVTALHECEKQTEGIDDDCLRILEIAKCFRTRVHDLHWAPKVDYIVEEVLTEL